VLRPFPFLTSPTTIPCTGTADTFVQDNVIATDSTVIAFTILPGEMSNTKLFFDGIDSYHCEDRAFCFLEFHFEVLRNSSVNRI
jgi:hypothetical protein